jgi:hypothetical protein
LTLDVAFPINEKSAAQSKSGFFVQYVISIGHASVFIAKKGVTKRTNATVFYGSVAPIGMTFCIVYRNTQNLGATLFKLTKPAVKSDEFRRSDESEILRVKEEDDWLAFAISKGNLLGGAIRHHCSGSEIRSGLVDEYGHDVFLLIPRKSGGEKFSSLPTPLQSTRFLQLRRRLPGPFLRLPREKAGFPPPRRQGW